VLSGGQTVWIAERSSRESIWWLKYRPLSLIKVLFLHGHDCFSSNRLLIVKPLQSVKGLLLSNTQTSAAQEKAAIDMVDVV
jgi:hypothetical protein